jgi:hypothetical protein
VRESAVFVVFAVIAMLTPQHSPTTIASAKIAARGRSRRRPHTEMHFG